MFPLKMVIFHCYVSSPEGIPHGKTSPCSQSSKGFHQQGPDVEALESHSSHCWTFPKGQGALGSGLFVGWANFNLLNQWPFQEPKLEVPTIHKAYFSGLCKGISPQNMAKHMVQYLQFRILEFPLILPCLCIPMFWENRYVLGFRRKMRVHPRGKTIYIYILIQILVS